MIRFTVDLTPDEFKVLKTMVHAILIDIQGDGTLDDEDDDNLTSLNAKLVTEIDNHITI